MSTTPSDLGTLVTLTIDGHKVSVPKGTLLVEAAKMAEVDIPVFCYHPKLKPVGACRMCLVEIEKMPRLQTACTTPVAEGMVVQTQSKKAAGAQEDVLELLLANHPLDCPVCDKGGECPLQDNTFKHGPGNSRFTEGKRHKDKAFELSDRIVLDRERCILCYRCVRFHHEIPGDHALAVIERGGMGQIGVLEGDTYDSPFSGNTIDICPVGALTSRQYRFNSRPWDLEKSNTVCQGCSVGCNVQAHSRDGRVLRLVPRENLKINDAWLCDKGRFDTMPKERTQRTIQPMVRKKGTLQPASWDEAFTRTIHMMQDTRATVIAGAERSNEALALLATAWKQQLSNAVDVQFVNTDKVVWPVQGTINALGDSKLIVLVGLDAWQDLPVLSLWIHRAVEKGARLVVIGQNNGQHRDTHQWLKVAPAQYRAVVQAMTAALHAEADTEATSKTSAPQGVDAALWTATIQSLKAESLKTGSASVLVNNAWAAQANNQEVAESLVAALSAQGKIGLAGALAPAANAMGMHLIAGAQTQSAITTGNYETVLALGTLPPAGSAKVIAVGSDIVTDRDDVEVFLPVAHMYEQAGSCVNLEGTIQRFDAGGMPAHKDILADWRLLAVLANRLGAVVPLDLKQLRTTLAAQYSFFAPLAAATRKELRLV